MPAPKIVSSQDQAARQRAAQKLRIQRRNVKRTGWSKPQQRQALHTTGKAVHRALPSSARRGHSRFEGRGSLERILRLMKEIREESQIEEKASYTPRQQVWRSSAARKIRIVKKSIQAQHAKSANPLRRASLRRRVRAVAHTIKRSSQSGSLGPKPLAPRPAGR